MIPAPRRVVTGLDAAGRSAVLIDGAARRFAGGGGHYAWRTDAVPADNSAAADTAPGDFSYARFHDGGSNFFTVDLAPGQRSSMHATDTIDYIAVLSGEVVLEVETGEARLNAGDVLVDRGVVHAWRNDGPDMARYAVVTVPAAPVGKGRSV